jgi:hypothetical protein
MNMHAKNMIIAAGIIILTIAAGIYGVSTFYNAPSYSDYCNDAETNWYINDSAQCGAAGGKWSDYVGPKTADSPSGYCDTTYTCRQQYDADTETYSRTVFLIALPLGIIIIAFGALVFGLEAAGAGLMAGGVGIILWGVSRFWDFAQDWLKFALSLAGLAVLVWLAYYFNRKYGKNTGKRKK